MLIRPAEESFRRGVEALARGSALEALALFEAAIEIEKRHGTTRPQARYLSYYGLCLGLQAGRLREGVHLCREALALEFYNPDLCQNLGRLLIEAGRRKEAYETLRKGLGLQPGHEGIQRELRRMGRRRRPVLPFLKRHNPLNVILGKLSRQGNAPAESLTSRGPWDPDRSIA